MGIFIKRLSLQNYKCFDEDVVDLKVPDGGPGSGLNILVGENGNGKTAVLEAINYLTLSSFSTENKLSINDFHDFMKEIEISASMDEFECGSSIDYYKAWSFKARGIRFTAKSRDTKEAGKLLSSPFSVHSYFIPVRDEYQKADGVTATDQAGRVRVIDGRDKVFSNSRIEQDALSIFYFDKNRTRQIATGTYKTTFERICDDLNWHFVKNLDEDNLGAILDSITGEYFSAVEKVTKKNVGKKTAKDLQEFLGNEIFSNMRIELLSYLHPYSNSFLALRDKDTLTQISVRDLGSGIEMILTLLMLKNIAGASKGSVIYLIDEPELHLHPKAQEKLLELLIEESKTKQIIVSTHSPYMFKGAISGHATLLLFTRDDKGKICITDARSRGWGLFPAWSPSWGEINYFAYNLPTVEFHDELYGFLHERYVGNAADQTDAENRSKIQDFDSNYLQRTLKAIKKWTPEYGGKPKKEVTVTLPTYIRNKIHHPENNTMKQATFDPGELRLSIDQMVQLIKNP